MGQHSRRRVLGVLGGAAGLGLAGCLSRNAGPRYQLSASNVPGSLAEHFRWEPRGPFPEADRRLNDRLVAEGTLTTTGFTIAPPRGFETPWYIERDGRYYEVTVERTGTVERERPILWFDLIEGEPPADAEVYTSSLGAGDPTDLRAVYGLSDRDAEVVMDAAGEVAGEGSYRDLEDAPPGRRGHVFVRRGPEDTDLLPDPPFTHVAFETGEGTRYARVVVERATVELRRYRYAARPVANSTDAYREHVRERYLETSFDRSELSGDRREILETITAGGGRYDERAPLSEALTAVLERLGLTGVPTPEPKGVTFSDAAYFRYDRGFYAAELQIFR